MFAAEKLGDNFTSVDTAAHAMVFTAWLAAGHSSVMTRDALAAALARSRTSLLTLREHSPDLRKATSDAQSGVEAADTRHAVAELLEEIQRTGKPAREPLFGACRASRAIFAAAG